MFPGGIYAQQCNNTFQNTLKLNGDAIGNAVVYTAQGDIMVAGKTNAGGAGKWDGLLIKTDNTGNTVWARSMGRADNDALVKVKQTADNGFIAIGNSELNSLPQLWVVKADAAGQITWSKVIDIENMAVSGKDIIELSGGGYALVANTNDSTAQADGILARLDPAGTPIWVQLFESGGTDGFNSLLELNGELLVTGFMAGDLKDAFLMRAGLNDGLPLSTLQYTRIKDYFEEGICLTAIPGGYSWGMKIAESETAYGSLATHLLVIKATAAGTNYLIQSQKLTSSGGGRVKNLQVKPGINEGYVYIMDGPPNIGFPQIGRTIKEGRQEWTRDYRSSAIRDFNGFDLTGNNGYVITGRINYMAGQSICLIKTDPYGIAGGCASNPYGGTGGGGDKIEGKPYQWQSTRSVIVNTVLPVTTVTDQQVSTTTVCSNQYCTPAPPIDNGDNCATSFFTAIKEEYSTMLADAVRTNDGDIVTIGFRSYYGIGRSEVIKLKPGGNIRWAKQFDPKATEDGGTNYSRIINTSDNNVLIVGEEAVIKDHSVYDSGFIMKMDYDGNVLWARRTAHNYGGNIAFVQETEDGGYIMVSNDSYGNPPLHNSIMKLDRNGNLVWQKLLIPSRTDKVVRALLYEKESVYVAFDFYNMYVPEEIMIVKLDAATGDFKWGRRFKAGTGEDVSILGMARINDTLYVGTGLQKELSFENYQFHGAVVKLKDDTGEQLPGFRLNNPWLSRTKEYVWLRDQTYTTFTKSLDDQLVIAHESATNKDTTIRVHKMALDGSITWSRNFTQLKKHTVVSLKADNGGFLITGFKYGVTLVNEPMNEGFLMRLNSDGEIENSTGACVSLPVAAGPAGANTIPLLLTEVAPIDPWNVGPVNIKTTSRVPVPFASPVLAYPSCASYSACQAATVQGTDLICDLSQTFTYTAQKPVGCTAPLTWKIDAAYAEIISKAGDQLTVKFKKAGSTTINALLDGGCKIYATSMPVEVAKPATTVNLGADLEICKGASVILDGGAGFKAYEWKDGSTAQTFEVTSPGTYEVTVTDKCNNQATDIIEVLDAGNYPFSLGPDILKCRETAITLNLPAGFGNFKWNTDYNRTDKTDKVVLTPETDTTYILEGDRGNGCIFKDTLLVKIQAPLTIGLPADQHICSGDAVQLEVGSGFSNIQWNTGHTGHILSAKAAGEYTVSSTDINGCIAKDTFRLLSLMSLPVVALPKENYICDGTEQVLNAGNDGVSYIWSTGANTAKITVNTAGKWWVKVTGDNGCSFTDTAWYKQVTPGPQGFLVSDTLMCLRGEIRIPVKGQFVSFHWSDGSNAPQLITRTPGEYWLEVTDQYGCTGRSFVMIGTKDCGWGVYVPTAFTPNNDGLNDLLRPVVMGKVNKYLFSVYDRWGTLVFRSNEVYKGWDGKINQANATAGAYIWSCVYQLEGEPEQIIKGSAVLIR
ncbi:T9SS type B sorting domain-containing protein [Chitinophaga niabensis]|uniref:Gliding motility-associated C-terminal domain-containing protein n=1 Tax=Chitinophaga niabensis TaxID=536979 RepID=A0A1N6DV36_9BACT|nr:gliding motility-associated C-terminal domain-containing protein [Chitinophaga niabensis]SIN74655.1 gliding motility-associated C-terminal domain-containing protein [Chitinophaga niabensis]